MSENSAPPVTSAPQQPSSQIQNAPVQVATSNATGDSLTCQWQNCGERCPTPEQLYDHVCERHVGRKSTNNLNLTCQWGNCRTTTVKRDHITSHIRVHVPLKPHKCEFCGKAFKRPQDLKKHVKTHADDSVLLRSPEPNRLPHGGAGAGGYGAANGKYNADLQSLAATASGYYPENGLHGQGYGHPNGASNGSGPFYGNPGPQNSAYGPVYYAVNQASNMNNDSYETRKRAAFDALNEFFGDAKRRQIDPATYYDVGHRLMGLQGAQLPMMSNGYSGGGGMSEYHGGGGGVHGPVAQHQYSLPQLPNMRTKNDLMNIDQFLEQLQSTVYENSSQAAASGVAQPGSHYIHPSLNYRSSQSPPGVQHQHIGTSHATAGGLSSAAPLDTPALTPASSVMSYTSGHSPGSTHSGHNISPISRPSIGSMYPTLPSVSAMGDASGAYATSGAPSSALGSAFDSDGRRRYSGGLLQKAAPDADRMDTSDGTPTPTRESPPTSGTTLGKDIDRLALASPGAAPSPGTDIQSPGISGDDRENQAWVENMRVIEFLREMVKHKLESREYEEEGSPQHEDEADRDAASLYPVLRAVQDSD